MSCGKNIKTKIHCSRNLNVTGFIFIYSSDIRAADSRGINILGRICLIKLALNSNANLYTLTSRGVRDSDPMNLLNYISVCAATGFSYLLRRKTRIRLIVIIVIIICKNM